MTENSGTAGGISGAVKPQVYSTNGTFHTLHNAYQDEWLTISFLPFIKTTFNTENHYYDISKLNLKKVNFHHLPISESILAMDRQYSSVRASFERIYADTTSSEIDRLLLLETYQSSFKTFIESEKMILEQAIIDIGGTPPDTSNIINNNNNINNINQNSLLSISRIQSTVPTTTATTTTTNTPSTSSSPISASPRLNNPQQFSNAIGPITILWCEFQKLLAKLNDESERQFYYESTITNIAPSIFEWRIMLNNSQKIISDDKKLKKNPFQSTIYYDHYSSSFISSPVNQTPNSINSPSTGSTEQLVDVSIPADNNNNTNHKSKPLPPPPVPLKPSSSSIIIPSNNNQNPITPNNSNNNTPTNESLNNTPTSQLTMALNQSEQQQQQQKELPTTPGGGGGWHKARINTTNKNPTSFMNTNINQQLQNSSSFDDLPSLSTSAPVGGGFISQPINNNNSSNSQLIHNNSHSSNQKGIPSGGIIKQGWMKKRGNKVKSWKKRYFILDKDRNLLYYNYKNQGQNTHINPDKEKDLVINVNNISLNNDNNGNNENPTPNNNNRNSKEFNDYIDNNNNNNNNSNSNEQQHLSYESLKHKGSIELHTAIAVAIKPKTCNINVNLDEVNLEKISDANSYFGIDIITPKRTWQICCDGQKSMEEWLLAIKGTQK